ncbi:MAG: DUF4401 domain-containing protein [Saprospiraceae bacterium]|nr:DUF4401 domain-containing protein [Saprospiraceae bacterium]
MINRENITAMLDQLNSAGMEGLVMDEEKIQAEYSKENNHHSMAIKVLSVFGGILASLTFIGFLFMAGLYDSSVALAHNRCIATWLSVWLNKAFDTILIDTTSISAFLISLLLMAFGLTQMEVDFNLILIIFILLSLACLVWVQNYVYAFISIMVINGCLLTLIMSNETYDLIHFLILLLTVALLMIFQKEAYLITEYKKYISLYPPLRIGMVISLLTCLFILSRGGMFPFTPELVWVSSLVMITGILYTFESVFKAMGIEKTPQKNLIYGTAILLLAPTLLSPAITGSLLILLLSFRVNYKTGFAIGVISFIYALSQYYYDLHFTLLVKSILMMLSGLLFLALYFVTHKNLSTDEKH